MKENRKQHLKRILKEAEKSAKIRTQFGNISVQKFKSMCLSEFHDPYMSALKFMILPDIQDSSVKLSLVEFLETEFSKYLHDGKIGCNTYSIFGGTYAHDLEHILKSTLKISIVWGPDRAVTNLEKSIEENCIHYKEMSFISGIRVKSELKISNGIRIFPLPQGANNFPHYLPFATQLTEMDFSGNPLMQVDCSISPAFYNPSSGFDPHTFSHSQSKIKIGCEEINGFDIYNFCLILSLICNCAARPYTRWRYLEKDEICIPTTGSFFTRPNDPFVASVAITESEIESCKILYEKFMSFDKNDWQQIKKAVFRWVDSKTNKDLADKMVDLGIAFEALYLKGASGRKMSCFLRRRASFYLGRTEAEREYLEKLFSKIYKCRSIAVHYGELDGEKNVKVLGETLLIRDLVKKSQDLCLESIKKIISAGSFPDWNNLISEENPTQTPSL